MSLITEYRPTGWILLWTEQTCPHITKILEEKHPQHFLITGNQGQEDHFWPLYCL